MSDPDSEGAGRLKVLRVPAEAAGSRLDQWLAAALAPELSRSRIQALIRAGDVALDGRRVEEPGRKLGGNETLEVTIPAPEPAAPAAQDLPLSVLYEDDDLIVIDKAAGMVVHPGAGNWTGTLVNALLHHCGPSLSGIGGTRRPGIVHRLDKETSGVMVVAKNDAAHRALAGAFADHGKTGDLERAYVALVWGAPRQAGTVDAPLGRAADRIRRAVVPADRDDARHAVTHYRVLERFGGDGEGGALASLVECRLETGRTHQIRVHMAHIGHPLVGDPDYGQGFRTKAKRLPQALQASVEDFPRQALHARLLVFRHPRTHLSMRFESELPEDMATLISAFRSL